VCSFVKFSLEMTDFRKDGSEKVFFLDFSKEIHLSSNKYSDFDLGLTISKQIVEKMDGSVSVDRSPDSTTFKIDFQTISKTPHIPLLKFKSRDRSFLSDQAEQQPASNRSYMHLRSNKHLMSSIPEMDELIDDS